MRYGCHDPIGAPITYLLNGAPWVIGNLWDVTDKDLDRLSMTCMEEVFDEERRGDTRYQISNALSHSRDVCKLKCAVGSAPVLYGIPIEVDHL